MSVDPKPNEPKRLNNRFSPPTRSLKERLRTESFADRRRFRPAELHSLASGHKNCEKMRGILAKKNVSAPYSDWTIVQTIQAAATHRLESARANQSFRNLNRSRTYLPRLIGYFDRLGHKISLLPPGAKGELNRMICAMDLRNFDAEMLPELLHNIRDVLFGISRQRLAKKAAKVDGRPRAINPKIDRMDRSTQAQFIEFWELIPAETRGPVEAGVRRWKSPKRGQINHFLKHLTGLLKKYRPVMEKQHRSTVEARYVLNVARIWRGAGLQVGRAYKEGDSTINSPFQRFARLALSAVGDEKSRVSAYQIRRVQEKL